ncbi:MAG: DUF3499 family protein [Nitriliruptoraceae bacterium]
MPADRRCARPDCRAEARATLTFSYSDQQAVLTGLTADRRPQTYDLCPQHAARTSAPYGWQLRDDRPEDQRRPVDAPVVPADLGSDHTVAVLAAALRRTPSTAQSATPGTASSPAPGPGSPEHPTAAAASAVGTDAASEIDALIDAPHPTATAAVHAAAGDADGGHEPARRPRPVLAARARGGGDLASGAPVADW